LITNDLTTLALRFQITEAHKAKAPIIVLIGELLEGEIRFGDRLSVPLKDGTRFTGKVMGIVRPYPDTGMYEVVRTGEHDKLVGIGIWRQCHEVDDIARGIVTNG
jgi:hypothetical protein